MARLQLILPLVLWALWSTSGDAAGGEWVSPAIGTAYYVATSAMIVVVMALAARRTMRRTTYDRPDAVAGFHRTAYFARWGLIALYGVALWTLGYGDAVMALLPPEAGHRDSLTAFVSIVPLVVAWVGLMAAQYPLDRSIREQNALYAVEFGEPVRVVPTLPQYLAHNVRSQIGFTLAPILAVWLLRDGLAWGLVAARLTSVDTAGWLSDFGAAAVVAVIAPEILRRVLPTQSLPPSPLRERMVALSRRLKLGVRDVLLWHTHHSTGNAAVMGLVPGVRYVMMTDLLVETMPPEQLEAVFVHEAGHVKHRHLAWYIAFISMMLMGLDVAGDYATRWRQFVSPQTADWTVTLGGLVLIVLLFGALSRLFERQADAFAARWMSGRLGHVDSPRDGAAVFAEALRHVARLNNLPMDVHSVTAGRPWLGRLLGRIAHAAATWLHGSIRSRIDHVGLLMSDPRAAERFDTKMFVIRCVLGAALLAAVVATVMAR